MKTSLSQSEKVDCSFCTKKVPINRMRQHIGYHIVVNNISNEPTTCGFCGSRGCHITLKKQQLALINPFRQIVNCLGHLT